MITRSLNVNNSSFKQAAVWSPWRDFTILIMLRHEVITTWAKRQLPHASSRLWKKTATNEPRHKVSINVIWATNKDSDQPAHTVFPRECVSARVRFWRNNLIADALTVCLWVFRDAHKNREWNSIVFMCRWSEDFQVYLDDNASKNIFPVENRPAHKYICWVFPWRIWLFQKRRLRMSKVIGDSHRLGFVSNNFGLFHFRCYFGALYSINFKEVV